MIQILFDFEVDTNIKACYPKLYYDRIRLYYSQCYERVNALTDMAINGGYYPVMILTFSEEGIKSIPFDIPDFIATLLHRTVTQEAFAMLDSSYNNSRYKQRKGLKS